MQAVFIFHFYFLPGAGFRAAVGVKSDAEVFGQVAARSGLQQ